MGNNQGFILFEYIKSFDSSSRKVKVVEQLPKDIMKKVIALVKAEVSFE